MRLLPATLTDVGDLVVAERTPGYEAIGRWSEVKLDILKKYSGAYSKILAGQGRFTHCYIDGFAGRGKHVSRETGNIVPGSPLNALAVQPPFSHYHFVELRRGRARILRKHVADRTDVTVHQGDCNRVLTEEILPRVRFDKFCRALCFLDPYGLHLDWSVIQLAGTLGTVDLFLNFPVMDMNMNALLRHPERALPDQAERMTKFWGDDSWRTSAYAPGPQTNLFEEEREKKSNEAIVAAFCERLRAVARFEHVARPLAMRNRTNAVIYYIVFASQKSVAVGIVEDIFKRQQRSGGA